MEVYVPITTFISVAATLNNIRPYAMYPMSSFLLSNNV